MNTDYALGLAVGILAALIIFGVVWKFNKRKMKGSFDERQELIRGRGYKYAFFTVMALLAIYLVADIAGAFEVIPVTHSLVIFTILLISVVVYALYCIRNDSYFGVGVDYRSYKAIMWVIIVINAVSAFMGMRDGLFENGKLAFSPISQILFVITFVIIMLALQFRNKPEDDDSSSDNE